LQQPEQYDEEQKEDPYWRMSKSRQKERHEAQLKIEQFYAYLEADRGIPGELGQV